MKYFLDTEFIEGFHKPLFGKRRHFIDLISIGIVCEDGRSYYMLSKEYNYNDADGWVKENVIMPTYKQMVSGDARNRYDAEDFHRYYGKSNDGIRYDIIDFVRPDIRHQKKGYDYNTPLEFYGYYADYDWALFCSLFGRMIDLPNGFPMYCRDLKQMLDELAERDFAVLDNHENRLKIIKSHSDYPKQGNEHNALADAKWNKSLFEFLKEKAEAV